jgi:Transglycosylase SLT domain
MIRDIPPAALDQWRPLVDQIATGFHLDPLIILAQVWTECEADLSNPRLVRYEDHWRWFTDVRGKPLLCPYLDTPRIRAHALAILQRAEFDGQSTSHGLMQMMGAVSRELGLRDDFAQLYVPQTNLEYGCMHLVRLLARANGELWAALSRYNGSALYATTVLRRKNALQESRPHGNPSTPQ